VRADLLVEDRLSLTTEASLLLVVTALALREQTGLASLLLRDTVRLVLLALRALAEGPLLLWRVHLGSRRTWDRVRTRLGRRAAAWTWQVPLTRVPGGAQR
jgi:hypothetical protein